MLDKLCDENDLRRQMPTLDNEFRAIEAPEIQGAIEEGTRYVYHDLDGRYDINDPAVIAATLNDVHAVIRLITAIRTGKVIWARYNVTSDDNQKLALDRLYKQWRDQMTEGALIGNDGLPIPTRQLTDPNLAPAPLERDTVRIYGNDPDTMRVGWPPDYYYGDRWR